MNPKAQSFNPSGFSAGAQPFNSANNTFQPAPNAWQNRDHTPMSAQSPSFHPQSYAGGGGGGNGAFVGNNNMGGGGGGFGGHRPHQGASYGGHPPMGGGAPHMGGGPAPSHYNNNNPRPFQPSYPPHSPVGNNQAYPPQMQGQQPPPQHIQPSQPQQQQRPPAKPEPPAGPPVVLLVDTDSTERALIAASLVKTNGFFHISVSIEEDAEEVTHQYKAFEKLLQDYTAHTKSDAPNARRGAIIEINLTYHYAEIFYFFDLLRNAKVFPTHIVLIGHDSLSTIPHAKEYDFEHRTRHPLPFEACLQVLGICDNQFEVFSEFESCYDKPEEAFEKCGSMEKLREFLAKPNSPLQSLPDLEPQGVFKFISLLPNVTLLNSATDRLYEAFRDSADQDANPAFYAKPNYVLDYATLSRNAFQLPHYYTTIDINGINTIIAKVDGQYLVFFPKYTALGFLEPNQIPEGLQKMRDETAAGGGAGTSSTPAATAAAATTSPTAVDAPNKAGASSSSTEKGIAWVINATISIEDVDEENTSKQASCTIYAKDIIMANGQNISTRSFASRYKILSDLVPESPANPNVIIVKQRYYNALETSKIFQKIEAGGTTGNATGNGLWFINPGKAQLRNVSSWNYKFSLPDGGFDARLWNAEEKDSMWYFDIHVMNEEGEEESIGTIQVSNEVVTRDSLNDGQIVRILMTKEQPAPEAPAPGGKKGGKQNANKAPPQQAEPKIVYKYMTRQHWTFIPTDNNPTQKRFGKKDLLEALEALK